MKSSSTPFSESFKAAELSVSEDPSSTKGLTPEALCTSHGDLDRIFRHPLVSGTWVDLGSGYGHTVNYYKEVFPEKMSIGVERELSRLSVARERGAGLFIEGDLLHCDIPEGNVYFLYFPQGHVLDRILSVLMKRKSFTLIAVESHGDFFPRLDKESWLSCRGEVPLDSQRHNPSARIYTPNENPRELSGLHRYSFLERYFLVGDWWGDSFGLFANGDAYELQHPPRTIREEDVVKIVTENELSHELRFLTALRRMENVHVHSQGKVFHGPFRKILDGPGLSVEFPSGQRLQWREIDRIHQGPHLCYDSSSRFYSLPPVL